MKIVSIILSLTLIFGLFTVNTFAYTRPENIVSEYNDFENGVGDWTNGLINDCSNASGNITESDTTVSVSPDTDGTHGKYLVVNNAGDLGKTATLMFDIDSARKTAAGAQANAKVKAGDYFGFEFDFKLPSDASSTTAIELMVWDTRVTRNRYTLVRLVPNTGLITAGSRTYTISKNTWYKMKLECVVGSAFQRFIVMDDSGKELFISNINDSSRYLPTALYGFVTFSQGGAGCVFYLDNTKAYTFAASDLNVGRIIFSDDEQHTLNSANPYFQIEAHNDLTNFNGAEEHPPAFVVQTKLRINNTTQHNDIKVSLIEEGEPDIIRLVTTISPYKKAVKIGHDSSGVSVGGLSMEPDIWYDVEIIYNAQSDYQRVEITNPTTGETQTFGGSSGYLPADISAFDGVLIECSCVEDTVADFDDLKIYVASQSHAEAFYTMDSYEIEADVSQIIIRTSAYLTNFSADKVTFKTDEGKVVPATISYDGENTVTIVPTKPFKENERMNVVFSKEILVNGEMPKFDSVLNIKVLISEIYMDFDLKADGETVVNASDIIGKSNISCNINSVNRTTEEINGIYVMTIMDKNGEIKGICADDVSVSASSPNASSSLSLPVPGDGRDLEIYIMLIDNFQSSKALAKYIKIH